MFRGVALARATARLGRGGRLPAVLFGGLPAGVASAPAALVGRPLAAHLDAALAHALAGLANGPGAVEEPVPGSSRRAAVMGSTPTGRPDRRFVVGPAGSLHPPDGFPDRAAGPGATVHGAAGGPSRLVHHLARHLAAASAAGVLSNARPATLTSPTSPASAVTRPVAVAPTGTAPATGWAAAGAVGTPAARVSPSTGPVTPVRVARDEATAELLQSLVAPTRATAERAGAPPATDAIPPRPRRADGLAVAEAAPTRSQTSPTAVPPTSAPPTSSNVSGSTVLAGPTAHPRRSEAILPASAPADLVELVRWWEAATPPAPTSTPAATAGPAAEPPLPVTSRVDDPRADDPGEVGADPLSTFRDALELVLLDEALADGLEVG